MIFVSKINYFFNYFFEINLPLEVVEDEEVAGITEKKEENDVEKGMNCAFGSKPEHECNSR